MFSEQAGETEERRQRPRRKSPGWWCRRTKCLGVGEVRGKQGGKYICLFLDWRRHSPNLVEIISLFFEGQKAPLAQWDK